ncbi:MAG: large conductance mechanosensitive channel protein MscL [Clostridia bacterium]|nr:large conductance mechanosensitive channel protein MscL [Clostridia bacterium]
MANKQSKFLKEFRDFAMKGNVIDLAVGVIIGGAFQTIIKSVVSDLINPLIGLLFKSDYSGLYIPLFSDEAGKAAGFVDGMPLAEVTEKLGLPVFAYGNFISNVINFIIMAFVIFLMVKLINKLSNIKFKKEEEVVEEAPTTKECPYCFSEIDIRATRCPHCTETVE